MSDFQYLKNQTFALDQIFSYALLVDLKFSYGYPSNLMGVSQRFVELSLKIQETAEQLSKYNTEYYEHKNSDPSGIPRIQDLPKSAKILVKEAGAYPFFPLYLPEKSIRQANLN